MSKIKLQIDNISRIFVGLAILMTIAQVILVMVVRTKLPPQVPLFYSLPWGEGQLASPQGLWWLPVICGLVVVTNFTTSVLVRQMVLTRVLSSAALLVALLALITLGKIVMLETI